MCRVFKGIDKHVLQLSECVFEGIRECFMSVSQHLLVMKDV